MEKLFEIVGSFIPEEQKADIKALFDGEYNKGLVQHETQVKKDLSSKFKVNLFEEDITKAFSETNFVDKTRYTELETKLNEQAGTVESLQKDKDELNASNLDLLAKEGLFNSQLNLVSNGLRIDRLDLIRPHITGNVEEDLKGIKETYPELFLGKQEGRTLFPKGKDDGLTDAQRYFQERAKKIKK